MSWRVVFEARSGPDAGHRFEHDVHADVVFGRLGATDLHGLRPSDPRVSRQHLVLSSGTEGVVATAAKEGAAFRINGQRLTEGPLRDGDRLEVGASVFAVRVTRASDDAALSAVTTDHVTVRPLSALSLETEVGRGAMGRVLRARDETGRVVCVKLLRQDLTDGEAAAAYFVREVDLLGSLHHPSIVRMLYTGPTDGGSYLGMEWVDGRDLQAEVAADGPLSILDACAVGRQLASALACAHAADVVHRDVKPSNVMVRGARGALHATLIDFGLARVVGEAGLTATGEARGTLDYASREALVDAKRAGPAADLFSLAATLYYALTAGPYYDEARARRNIVEVMGGQSVVPLAERRPDAPPALAALVESNLSVDPGGRSPSAAEMLDALVRAESEALRAGGP